MNSIKDDFTMDYLSSVEAHYRLIGYGIQNKWLDFLELVGEDEWKLWVFGTAIIVITVYWFYAGLFTLMELTNFPKFLRKYKLQPGQNEPIDKDKLAKAIKQVVINQTVVSVPFYLVLYMIKSKFMAPQQLHILPNLSTIIWQLVVFAILEEIMFYYSHRLLHHKSIYKFFHKKHHEWTAPIAAITFYSHPVEHVFSNMLPVAVTIGLLRCHLVTAWIMGTVAIINSMTDHTGYSFPFSPTSVRFHDLHHEKFNYNYGVFGFLDKFHGTFRSSEVPQQKPKKPHHLKKSKSVKNNKTK